MSEPSSPPDFSLTLVLIAEAAPETYSLETAARLAGVHPDMLRHYCRLGLFGEAMAGEEGALVFDDTMLYELRRFEHYRLRHGVSRKTLRLVCGLWREVERLQNELRFLRER
jgi:DNA-binding transcriptional MerR regulator